MKLTKPVCDKATYQGESGNAEKGNLAAACARAGLGHPVPSTSLLPHRRYRSCCKEVLMPTRFSWILKTTISSSQ